jgi:hypothetical protein
MKYLVTCRPAPTTIPPERVIAMTRVAMDWIEARLADGSMETTYVFPHRGGIAIMEAGSPEELMRMLHGYPLYPVFTWEVQALCDWRQGFENVIELLQRSGGLTDR